MTARPTFSLVTGRDFGRANAWAKKQPNAIAEFIRTNAPKPKPEKK